MKAIDYSDVVHPSANLDIESEHVPIVDDVAPICLGCKEQLLFTEGAAEGIAFMRMCEVTQSVFSCPECGCRMVIFPKGKVPLTDTDEVLVVGPPEDGFFIALAHGST
jgi:predicted RNA-binding Zn-ribbon protein involved in translation (DUF1610 family)